MSSSSNNNNPQGNIFLTTENLAFSMPLILVCGTYAYFKIVPLKYGIPILVGVFVIFQIQGQIKAREYGTAKRTHGKTRCMS